MNPNMRVALILAALLAFSSAAAVLAVEIQNFDSANDAYLHGWVGFNNDPVAGTGGAGGIFKWSNTDNTVSTSPAGEAGGLICGTDGIPAYYADVNIGPNLTVLSTITASGELFYDDNAAADANLLVGYFDRNQAAGAMNSLDNTMGFSLAGGQIRANAFGGDYGGYNGAGGDAGAARTAALPDGVYTWTLTFNNAGFTPGVGQFNFGEITLTLDPAAAGPNIVLRNALNPLQNRLGRPLNAFGMISYNGGDADSFLTDTVFIDGLQYTAVPEPSSLLLTFFGLASLGFFRRISLSR